VFRWRKSTGDVWGDSPVRQALPDIKTVNTMVEQVLNSSEFAALGAWQTSDPTLEGKRLEPGSIIVSGQTERLEPIQFPGQLSFAYNDIQSLQQSIKERLFANQLPPAGEVKGVVATAINALQAQFFRHIAPAALRLEVEFLKEIINNTVRIAGKNGLMGEFIVNGHPLQISVQSVVRKGLELEVVQQIMDTLQLLGPFQDVAMKHLIDVPAMVRFILEKTDFPMEFIKDQDTSSGGMDTNQMAGIAEEAMKMIQSGGLPGATPM
jgi:hypothetical protein